MRRQATASLSTRALQILRNVNRLLPMTAMALAVLAVDAAVTKPMSRIQPAFADYLPELLH